MKKFLIILIASLLFGFSAQKQSATITNSHIPYATINKNIQKGLTGYVIHNNMVIAKALSLGDNHIKYLPLKKLENKALATPKIMPKTGDKVIFGLYNFRGLIIAPTQSIYLKIKQNNPNISFVSSDIFANYFETKPTKENFQAFCRDFNVGVIYFALDKEYIVDCDSFVVLDTKNIKTSNYSKPFFANYDKFDTSIFSFTPSNWIDYYKSMLRK